MLENEFVVFGIVAVLSVALISVLILSGKKELVKKAVLTLVLEAETKYGSGTGDIKYEYVVEQLHARFPKLVKVIFTETMLDDIIENAVALMKEILATK